MPMVYKSTCHWNRLNNVPPQGATDFNNGRIKELEQMEQNLSEEREEAFINLLASIFVESIFEEAGYEDRDCISENIQRPPKQPQHSRSTNDGSGLV